MKKNIIVTTAILVLIISAIIFSESVLQKIGEALVYQDPLEPADAIVVLAGSGNGSRMEAGAHLFARGFGKVVIFSSPLGYPGAPPWVLMQNYAIKLGVPKTKIIAKELKQEISTWGEGIFNLKILEENNTKSFIVVTSAYHTNRTHAVYKKLIENLGYDFKLMVYPAKDSRVPIKNWWKSRTGQKSIFIEYLATLNYYREHWFPIKPFT